MKRHSLLLILALMTSIIVAQSPARTGNDYAYFFYVSKFQSGWEKLPETKEEATAIARELESNYGFKTKVFPNFTKQQILDKITEINKQSYTADDQVLFFFSSHGDYNEETERGYLIPSDGASDDPYGKSWISYEDLGTYITINKSEHILLAIDACYSGAFGDRYKSKPEKLPETASQDCATQVKFALAHDSRLYFTSGSKKQRTPAVSLFARQWLFALQNGAEKGIIRINDLRHSLGTIDYPTPEGGSFTKDKGGGFVFVHKNTCHSKTTIAKNPAWDDDTHWKAIQNKLDTENTFEHLRKFENCSHKNEIIAFLNNFNLNSSPTPPDNFVFIKGGSFQMGSEDKDAHDNEKPVHQVSVDDFYMGRFEVTFEEYDAFCEATGKELLDDRGWGRKNRPVIHVSWLDAVAYCNWLSQQHQLQKVYTINGENVTANWNADGYRLPTEAEWEYAARSRGKDDKWAGTSSESELAAFANYGEEYSKKGKDGYAYTAPVGSFNANDAGLHDMSGNVWEWCWDRYDKAYYANSKNAQNPKGSDTGLHRVLRGGSWGDDPAGLRWSNRDNDSPGRRYRSIGFRLSRAGR